MVGWPGSLVKFLSGCLKIEGLKLLDNTVILSKLYRVHGKVFVHFSVLKRSILKVSIT